MSKQHLLVYSNIHRGSAEFQIRVAGALEYAGLTYSLANELPESESIRLIREEIQAVIIHRGIGKCSRLYELVRSEARKAQIPLIYDIDDLLVQVPSDHPGYSTYRGRLLANLKAIVDADLVVASTEQLANSLQAFHNEIHIIPNRLPPDIWRGLERSPSKADSRLTVGYIGTPSHVPDLRLVSNTLRDLLDRFAGKLEFLSVGVKLDKDLHANPAVRYCRPPRAVRKSYAEFARFAASLPIDIGIAPLADTPFNRCKSDLKFLEYAELGIPAVFSDLAPYQQRVKNGTTGFLAATESDWTSALTKLIESRQLRSELANNAKSSLLDEQNQQAWPQAIARATEVAANRKVREQLSNAVTDIYQHQLELERQLQRTLKYRLKSAWGRLLTKAA